MAAAADDRASVFVEDSPSDPPHEAIKANMANMAKDFLIVTVLPITADGPDEFGRSPSGDDQLGGPPLVRP